MEKGRSDDLQALNPAYLLEGRLLKYQIKIVGTKVLFI